MSIVLSPLWYSALWTVAIVVVSDYGLNVLKSDSLLALFRFLLSVLQYSSLYSMKCSKMEGWGNSKSHLNFFPHLSGIPVFHCLIYSVLKSIVSYILNGFLVFTYEGKYGPCYFLSKYSLVLFWISDFSASSTLPGIEQVISKFSGMDDVLCIG